jgi:hypothetical protein
MPAYVVVLRHTDPQRRPHEAAFVAWGHYEGDAIIKATDEYRRVYGSPERGTTHGIRWVNCDFTIERSARYIQLEVAAADK